MRRGVKMDNKMDEQEYIFIPDDEGNEEKFEIVYQFDYENNQYILLTPADLEEDEEAEADVYAFRYEENEDGIRLYTIEDEKEWDMIEEVLNTLDNEFNQ